MGDFRHDINALRAIAVISVLLFHLKIPFFSGGFAGVDVFFVISGYLMTRIIIDGIDNKEFSFINFWSNRIKRIVPALLFLVFIVMIIGFFFYLPDEFMTNAKNATSSLLFYSNILYWNNSGYFDAPAANNIFLHTWSLSVEWQFYLIYPIVLWGACALFKKRLLVLLLIFMSTFLLFGLSIFWTHRSATASFYLLPTRTWEMLFGGLSLFLEKEFSFKNKPILICSYATIFLSVLFLNDRLLWPGISTLIPVTGTFLIILLNESNYSIFKNNAVRFTGKISYSLYLWHWPIIVFAQYMGFRLNPITIIGIIILSFLFAYFSNRFIESIRFKTSVPLIVTVALLAVTTNILSTTATNKMMFKPQTLQMADYFSNKNIEIDKQFSRNCCFIASTSYDLEDLKRRDCLKVDTNKKNILLLGDSHAACLSASFREMFADHNINLLQATSSFPAFPFLWEGGSSESSHQLFHYVYYDFLVKNKKYINGVILGGSWYPNTEKFLEPLSEVCLYLKNLDIPIIIIGQCNVYTLALPSVMAKGLENNTDVTDFFSDKKAVVSDEVLKERLKPYYVDIYYKTQIPKLSTASEPYMFDSNHFSKYGADLVVKKIFSDPAFKAILSNKQF